MAAAVDRGAHDHLALQSGQCRESGERFAYGEPALDLVVHASSTRRPYLIIHGDRPRPAKVADGDVVDDAVQPRASIAHLGLQGAESDPGLQQGLLKHVLGRGLGTDQPTRVAQELAPVALHERLEGPLVSRACELQQPAVRLGLEKAKG